VSSVPVVHPNPPWSIGGGTLCHPSAALLQDNPIISSEVVEVRMVPIRCDWLVKAVSDPSDEGKVGEMFSYFQIWEDEGE